MKILILNHFIENYTGSEINAIQLCEGLKSLGIHTDIGTFIFKSPMRELVAEKGIKVFNLLEEEPEFFDYDLIWAHHAPVLAYLLFKKHVADTKIIFSSLSPILPLEGPPIFITDIYYYLSLSTKNTEVMINSGVPAERIHYFPNYAPENFFHKSRKEHACSPQKVAVVSNHPPVEVREFADIAKENQVQVDFIGTHDEPVFVDEELLLNYDLVITIGKTIQYCFALKIPVYCYDHFGGQGYINEENYEFSRANNFSGRLSEIKRGKDELFSDIFDTYQQNLNNLEFLYKECQQDFCLESNLKVIISDFQKIPITNIQKFKEKNLLSERVYDSYLVLLKDIFSLQHMILAKNKEFENVVISYEAGKDWKLTHSLRMLKSNKLFGNAKELVHKFLDIPLGTLRYKKNEQYLSLLKSSDLFDEDWYLNNYPDVAIAKISPTRHYLLYGGFEGRNPGPNFSSSWYLSEYSDVKEARINPLVHYLLHGKKEGRFPMKAG